MYIFVYMRFWPTLVMLHRARRDGVQGWAVIGHTHTNTDIHTDIRTQTHTSTHTHTRTHTHFLCSPPLLLAQEEQPQQPHHLQVAAPPMSITDYHTNAASLLSLQTHPLAPTPPLTAATSLSRPGTTPTHTTPNASTDSATAAAAHPIHAPIPARVSVPIPSRASVGGGGGGGGGNGVGGSVQGSGVAVDTVGVLSSGGGVCLGNSSSSGGAVSGLQASSSILQGQVPSMSYMRPFQTLQPQPQPAVSGAG